MKRVELNQSVVNDLNSGRVPLNSGKKYDTYTGVIVKEFESGQRFLVAIDQVGVVTYGDPFLSGERFIDVDLDEVTFLP